MLLSEHKLELQDVWFNSSYPPGEHRGWEGSLFPLPLPPPFFASGARLDLVPCFLPLFPFVSVVKYAAALTLPSSSISPPSVLCSIGCVGVQVGTPGFFPWWWERVSEELKMRSHVIGHVTGVLACLSGVHASCLFIFKRRSGAV